MSEETTSRDRLSWFAGLFDGEGSIGFSLHSGYPSPQAMIAMCDEPTIVECRRILDSYGIRYGHNTWKPKNGTRWVWKIHVSGYRSLETFLNLIVGYLYTKKPQAKLVLEYIEWRLSLGSNRGLHFVDDSIKAEFIGRRELIIQQLDAMNPKGPKSRKMPTGTQLRSNNSPTTPTTTTRPDVTA